MRSVIVVGMPRSGTSLTAAIFARSGYHVGSVKRDRYREGDEHNPFGYFEADEIVKRNAALFQRAGFPHHNTWLFDRMQPEVLERLQALDPEPADEDLVARYRAHAPWLWKDPRLTYTIGFWLPLVQADDPAIIVTQRDPAAVVNSFRRMGWPIQPDLEERVDEHVAVARQALDAHGVPYVMVGYEEYFNDPVGVARRLSEHTGVDIAPSDLNVRRELDHAADGGPRLRRGVAAVGRRLPVGVRRTIRRVLPRRYLELLLPELRHVARSEEERRRRGTPAPRR